MVKGKLLMKDVRTHTATSCPPQYHTASRRDKAGTNIVLLWILPPGHCWLPPPQWSSVFCSWSSHSEPCCYFVFLVALGCPWNDLLYLSTSFHHPPSTGMMLLENRDWALFLWHLCSLDQGLSSVRWKVLHTYLFTKEQSPLWTDTMELNLLSEHTVTSEEQEGKKVYLYRVFPGPWPSKRSISSESLQHQQDKI